MSTEEDGEDRPGVGLQSQREERAVELLDTAAGFLLWFNPPSFSVEIGVD